MSSIIKASAAGSLAVHAAILLARAEGQRLRIHDIAVSLGVSEAHLAKVLARLEHAGLVQGTRGPDGGYLLRRPAASITLKEVYEAVEGPLEAAQCAFHLPGCQSEACILGRFFRRLNEQVTDRLAKTRISSMKNLECQNEKPKKDHKNR